MWAEIEHEIVYKSGIKFPVETQRRFASLAGTLELLDGEFLALRGVRHDLMRQYRARYEQNKDPRTAFDVARLWAFLEFRLPNGRSWERAIAEGEPFPHGLDVSCTEALKEVGLSTPASLGAMIGSVQFRAATDSFAADQGIAPAEVSHVAVVVLAVALKDRQTVRRHFPEFMNDPALASILQS